MSDLFKHIGEGQFPSSGEYNRLVDAVTGLLRSTDVQYISDSQGVHVRRTPRGEGKTRYALGLHGGGTPLAVPTNVLTTIPIDFTNSDPDGWMNSVGFVVPFDGIYFASAAFWVVQGLNADVPAFVVGRDVTGAVNLLKSVPEVTLPVAVGATSMLFHINGMIDLEHDHEFQYMFWHEAGGANTMEMSNSLGAHAGLWLIEHL